jgi:uncharacterized membrane protein
MTKDLPEQLRLRIMADDGLHAHPNRRDRAIDSRVGGGRRGWLAPWLASSVPTSYHRFAGSSLDRLSALSDGIFAVAMTLLVLNVLNVVNGQPTPHDLVTAHLGPRLLTYLMSFLTLGIFWNGQQAQLNQFDRGDFRLTWIHLLFLFAVTLMPFSTALLEAFITYPQAVLAYWVNLLLLGALLWVSLRYATRAHLLKQETDDVRVAHQRRIITYQILYASAVAFCFLSTYVSIGLLIALQVTSVVAPRIGRFGRVLRRRHDRPAPRPARGRDPRSCRAAWYRTPARRRSRTGPGVPAQATSANWPRVTAMRPRRAAGRTRPSRTSPAPVPGR